MKVVTVQGYDCCPYTHSVWVHPHINPKDKIDLGSFANDRKPDDLIKALKQAGFKTANAQTISFGGNL